MQRRGENEVSWTILATCVKKKLVVLYSLSLHLFGTVTRIRLVALLSTVKMLPALASKV